MHLLLIDKPAGMTSHDVVDEVRWIFQTRRVGHAGTLDPFATGLLIVGVNQGTKKLTALVGLDKEYEVTARLGASSTTFDIEGEITPTISTTLLRPPSRSDIETVLERFRGGYAQRAPIFSAKKINGKKLYELARAGQATEAMRTVKQVTITRLDLVDYAFPDLRLFVSCSSGTYIRSLVDDIGRALGSGAYATALRRIRIGPYASSGALSLEKLRATYQMDKR